VRDGPRERRNGGEEAEVVPEGREDPAGRGVVEDSGLVGEGAVCSRWLEGEVDMESGLRGRVEGGTGEEEGEGSMPCLVEEGDNWRRLDIRRVAAAAEPGSAAGSLVLLEGTERAAEGLVWELVCQVAGCLLLRH